MCKNIRFALSHTNVACSAAGNAVCTLPEWCAACQVLNSNETVKTFS